MQIISKAARSLFTLGRFSQHVYAWLRPAGFMWAEEADALGLQLLDGHKQFREAAGVSHALFNSSAHPSQSSASYLCRDKHYFDRPIYYRKLLVDGSSLLCGGRESMGEKDDSSLSLSLSFRLFFRLWKELLFFAKPQRHTGQWELKAPVESRFYLLLALSVLSVFFLACCGDACGSHCIALQGCFKWRRRSFSTSSEGKGKIAVSFTHKANIVQTSPFCRQGPHCPCTFLF